MQGLWAELATITHARPEGTYGTLRVKAERADYYGQVLNKKLVKVMCHEYP